VCISSKKQGDVKMKKKELSSIELKKVVELRHFGTKWTEIEKETGVERRAAKRAYDEWEKDQKMREQETVRFRVAAEAFHEHLSDLTRLAESLISVVHVPEKLRGLDNAEAALGRLLMGTVQGGLETSPTSSQESARLVWRNTKLLNSLQDHTREKVRWEALEEWKKARTNAAEYSQELLLQAKEGIEDILNKQPGLTEKIKTAIGVNIGAADISRGLGETIWRGIVTGKLEEVHSWKGGGDVTKDNVWLEFYEGDSDTRLYLNDNELAKEIKSMCQLVVSNLQEGTKSDVVEKLTKEVRLMQDTTRELEEGLDELVLRPLLLRTRCDLCPA